MASLVAACCVQVSNNDANVTEMPTQGRDVLSPTRVIDSACGKLDSPPCEFDSHAADINTHARMKDSQACESNPHPCEFDPQGRAFDSQICTSNRQHRKCHTLAHNTYSGVM